MVTLDENASVKNIKTIFEDVKKEYADALQNSGSIVFDFGSLRRLDMSIAQVVVASVHKAHTDGIKVGIRSAGEDVRKQLYICGLKL